MGLPITLLTDIVDGIHNREQCIRLAVKLNLGIDEVLRILAQAFTSKMPCCVLSKFMETHRPQNAGPVLYSALCEIERQDLAERFEDQLLANGKQRINAVSSNLKVFFY